MTEPRLRAVVTALVGAIAGLAFLVSFRAISQFAVQTGAFPHSLGWAAPLLVDSFTLAAQAVAGIPPVALLLALELLMRGARLYLAVQGVDSPPESDTARERLRAWLVVNPSTPLTARQAAELLGVSRSRAGVLLQQERAAANGQPGGPP